MKNLTLENIARVCGGTYYGPADKLQEEVMSVSYTHLDVYKRQAVGMVKPNDYVLLVTDTGSYNGLNHWDMVNIFKSYGCTYAYNLDGGGSATLYFNGKVMRCV